MLQLSFADKCVTYDTFVNDLAAALVPKLKAAFANPSGVVSQRKAFAIYGQGNVRRWIKEGRLLPIAKRPGKIEYSIEDLERLKHPISRQDYF